MEELKIIALNKLKTEDYSKSTSSAWETYVEPASRINELPSLAAIKKNPSLFLRAFSSTPEEQKKQLTPMLKDWVENFDEGNLNNESINELRDFIYEMF
ncbi:MAG: hypothetical protein JXR07_20090 [Reichenbachiella sp.]